MTTGADVQAAFCATVVDEWCRSGITEAVVAPGSRSTPLLAALRAEPRLRAHIVLDERSAGFVALGIGLATGRPAPVVTTSGTAAVELHPAVVEAHHASVPLVAVTADRPPELHHVGAPQTIEQEQLFAGTARWAVSPGPPDVAASGTWRSLASRVVATAIGAGSGSAGPVHLNLAFREPLLDASAGQLGQNSAAAQLVPAGRPNGAPWHRVAGAPSGLSGAVLASLDRWSGKRGLIVAGAGAGPPGAVLEMARALGWPVMAEPRSECRVHDPLVIGAADALLRIPEVAAWQPEVVLRLGQPWASKVVNQWLGSLGLGTHQILVDPYGTWNDPDRSVSQVIAAFPADSAPHAAGQFASRAQPPGWAGLWQRAEAAAQEAIQAVLGADGGLTEPGVARAVVEMLPAGSTLVASSSMPVRDVEWYGAPRDRLRVLANRGANGIDGVVSTTLGAAIGSGAPTAGLIGDLAFLHDAGGLLWSGRRPLDATLIVVDNGGGGIFSFLPQAAAFDSQPFETFWGTPHGLDVAAIAQAYQIPVTEVGTIEDLRHALPRRGSGLQVAVVRMPDRQTNVAVHNRINAAVAASIRAVTSGS